MTTSLAQFTRDNLRYELCNYFDSNLIQLRPGAEYGGCVGLHALALLGRARYLRGAGRRGRGQGTSRGSRTAYFELDRPQVLASMKISLSLIPLPEVN